MDAKIKFSLTIKSSFTIWEKETSAKRSLKKTSLAELDD